MKAGGASSGAVWVLLTRHITDKDDFAHNKVFFTLLVYKGGKGFALSYWHTLLERHTHVHTHTHTNTQTHTQKQTHAYTHTHTHIQIFVTRES